MIDFWEAIMIYRRHCRRALMMVSPRHKRFLCLWIGAIGRLFPSLSEWMNEWMNVLLCIRGCYNQAKWTDTNGVRVPAFALSSAGFCWQRRHCRCCSLVAGGIMGTSDRTNLPPFRVGHRRCSWGRYTAAVGLREETTTIFTPLPTVAVAIFAAAVLMYTLTRG